SRIVSETVGNYLFNQFKTEKGLEIKNRVLRWNSEDQRAVWEFMNHHFRQAAVLAVNNISSAAILAEDKVKSFSTTLLATVTFRDGADLFAASFWLGDGAIAAYGPAGKVRVLGTTDSGEYAGQTRFLDADAVSDAGFSKRISIGKWNDISHLVLMTDGVSDPWFETDNGLQNPQKWDRLMAELSPLLTDPEHASAQLVEWLNFFSPGNHDDRTIIVLW
ncbi:protein phosphatase 2C domain-containing protein, partial [Escherichia coli]